MSFGVDGFNWTPASKIPDAISIADFPPHPRPSTSTSTSAPPPQANKPRTTIPLQSTYLPPLTLPSASPSAGAQLSAPESIQENNQARIATAVAAYEQIQASKRNPVPAKPAPVLVSNTTPNTDVQIYYWDSTDGYLVKLASLQSPSPEGAEILIFPIGSYLGPILPSDYRYRHEFIRNQRCVKYCDYDYTDVIKRSPVRLREHVLNCGHRKLFYNGLMDPLSRLCELQLRYLR